MKNARARAAQHLAPVICKRAALSLESIDAEDPDRGLISELCYGTLRYLPALQVISGKLLRKGIRDKDADVLALLFIGLYQIRYLRVADHAAVSETVQAAKQLKKPWATGLLNAALRKYLATQDELDKELSNNPVYSTAHPQWLVNSIQRQWPEQCEQIFDAANSRPPMTLRVNLQKQSRELLRSDLAELGIEASPGKLCDSALQLKSAVAVHRIPGFDEGFASVQDESAQLAAYLLGPHKAQRVLDACAAPGGKTGHLLERSPEISLTALDIDETRIAKVEQNLDRLGCGADIRAADASDLDGWWNGETFDRILIDAPCSGTGVMRRHPDIKQLRTPEDVSGFRERQIELLETLWSTLVSGGKLLYVTCSILKSENQDVVNHFAKNRDDVEFLPIEIDSAIQCNPGIQLLPMADGNDGFYYVLMAKQSMKRAEGTIK